ncbi:MAG: hypothetical protein APF77_23880 [Clostridia bacterium BRH_c25]|nr:MAG: hypothetical protein APF77_23880 [Clostridia bacterium BRH_c25]
MSNESKINYLCSEFLSLEKPLFSMAYKILRNQYDAEDVPHKIRTVLISKNGSPVFAANLKYNENLNFAILPKFYIARSPGFKKGDFFNAAILSGSEEVDYEGQQNVMVEFKNDVNSISIDTSFCSVIPGFSPCIDMVSLFPDVTSVD